MKIEIYTTPTCGFCTQSKTLVANLGFEYTEHMITAETRDALIAELSSRMGSKPTSVPQIFIDDEYIGGYTNLVEWSKQAA